MVSRRTFKGTSPRALGSAVAVKGRVRECAQLVRPAERLLDVGCSSGWLGELAIGRGVSEYVGLDRHIDRYQAAATNLRFVSGSALDLPFADQSFEAVTIFDVIQELPRGSEPTALGEALRVLRPGGTLYLSAPHASVIHTPLDPVWFFGQRHYRRATIARFLSDAGFRLEDMFVAGGAVESASYLYSWLYRHLFHQPPRIPQWVDGLVEREHSRRRGLGHTIFVTARRPRC